MERILKVAHLVALALFLGSIPGHIVLGRLADPAADAEGFALLMHATPDKVRWMAAKLALVALITVNGAFILTPLARDISGSAKAAVAAGTLPAGFADLTRRESAFGAANLAMVLAVIALAVARPGRAAR